MVVVKIGDVVEEVATAADLEKFCRRLREMLEGECQYHSWYIRIPVNRLLALLKKAYVKFSQGVLSVGDVLGEYLEENKLSKSLARTITPTLSALGLSASGKFTSAAVEIGRLLAEGRLLDAKSALRRLALRNCVLRDILERLGDCGDVEGVVASVLEAYGKGTRLDELKYTAELVKYIDPRCEECDFKCATPERLAACADRLVGLAYQHIRELFEKLDISLLPEHLELSRQDSSTYILTVKGTAKQIGLALVAPPVEGGDLQQLKLSLARLDERITEGIYEVYVKVVPVLEGSAQCKSLKLLLEVVRGDLERASKFVKLASTPP